MKNLLAKLGGTVLEPPLLKIFSAVSGGLTRTLAEERQFWLREGLSAQMQSQLEPLRQEILKHESFFTVPTNSWLVSPIGIAKVDLATTLKDVIGSERFGVVEAVSRIDLSFESDWSPVTNFSNSLVRKVGSRELQLAFVPKGTMGTERRMIPLEVWKKNSKGNLVSPAWNNVFAELGLGEATKGDLERAAKYDNLYDVNFPIDAVYLWVDGSDPTWLAKKSAYDSNSDSSHGSAASRFISRNELYFSIRSLLDHARWVNKIWVVTDGQTPDLGEFADLVTVIEHKDFIPADYLPTFNSHTITANLHRIEGLSEHFLYLNDDIFFGRNLHPGIWFDTLGRSVVRYTKTLLPGFETNSIDTIHRIRQNTVALGHAAGYKTTTRSIQHGPHPLQKQIMAELWKAHPESLETTCRNRFRSETDIVPEWLHNFAAITSARSFVGGKLTYNYVVLNARATLPKILALFVRRLPSVLCLNDVSELAERDRASEVIVELRLRLIAKLLETKK
ncbi:MAG: Stealth CR1 domain-containing protein [Microbacteriaceae bacterium]